VQYRFENYLLDTEALELSRNGERVPMPARILGLLVHLVENRHRVVSREELADHGWPGRYIADQTLTSRLSELRAKLGDKDGNRLIRTVYGEGVRFVGDATRHGGRAAEIPGPGRGMPSIAVLAFRVRGEGLVDRWLATAVADDLLTGLSRLKTLFVIARGSSFRFTSFDSAPIEAGLELGVEMLVSGSVESMGDKLAVSVELSSTSTGRVIWRERYDLDRPDVPGLPQDMAGRIAAAIDREVTLDRASQARGLPGRQLDAWNHYHLGWSEAITHRIDQFEQPRTHFLDAIAVDPKFARAHIGLAQTYFCEGLSDLIGNMDTALDGLRRASDDALACDPSDPYAHLMLGRSHVLASDWQGIEHIRNALEISPNVYFARTDLGRIYAMTGLVDEARKQLHAAHELSPFDPWRFSLYTSFMVVELACSEFPEAARWARLSRDLPFRSAQARLAEMGSLHMAGDEKAAREIGQEFRMMHRDFDFGSFHAAVPVIPQPVLDIIETGYRTYVVG